MVRHNDLLILKTLYCLLIQCVRLVDLPTITVVRLHGLVFHVVIEVVTSRLITGNRDGNVTQSKLSPLVFPPFAGPLLRTLSPSAVAAFTRPSSAHAPSSLLLLHYACTVLNQPPPSLCPAPCSLWEEETLSDYFTAATNYSDCLSPSTPNK